jgi:hypothetical protein
MRSLPGLCLLLSALLACGATPDTGDPSPEDTAPAGPRRAVFHVVGPTADAVAADLEDSRFTRWVLSRLDGWESGVSPGLPGEGDPRPAFSVVTGTLPLPPMARALARGLPVEIGDSTLALGGTTYEHRHTAMALRLPEGSPAGWLVVGYESGPTADLAARVAADEVRRMAGSDRRWRDRDLAGVGYLVQDSPYLSRRGRFREGPDGFTVDPAADEDELAERDARLRGLEPVGGTGSAPGRVILRAPAARRGERALAALRDDLDQAAAGMIRSLALPEGSTVTAVVEDGFESQGRATGAIGLAVEGGAPGIDLHLVLDPETTVPGDRFAYRHGLARVLLRRAIRTRERTRDAPAPPPWLFEGAALIVAGGEWYGRPHGEWAPVLRRADALPTARQLLEPRRSEDASEVLWPPVAAWVVEGLPGDGLVEKITTHVAPATVERLLDGLRPAAPAPTGTRRAAASSLPFLDGVSFAMDNGLDTGYHAASADRALTRLRRLGANAVSLMPFAYQEHPGAPALAYLNDSPGSETDIGVLHAARRAHSQDLVVLWKPQIWLPGSWPGEVAMTSEADWDAWWSAYRRFILHHAVLAARAEAEVLSIGVELGRTLGRTREWDELITAARALYPGLLTYSANWHGDAEEAPFWDRLDLVGVDAYYPLAAAEEVSGEALAAGAAHAVERLETLAREHGRPVLLTEVGFAARRFAWHAPHEEGGEVSGEDQARAYDALFTTLGKPPWLAGVFVWKAFSSCEDPAELGRRAGRPDFRFLNRPAEAVVREYFGNKP